MSRGALIVLAVVVAALLAGGAYFLFGRSDQPAVEAAPAPTVTAVSPNTGYHGLIARAVTVRGTGFAEGARVTLERPGRTAVPGESFSSEASALTGGAFLLDQAETGAWDVVVTNPDGQRGACSGCFSVLPQAPAPTVTKLSVSRAGQNSTIDATLSGTGFQAGTSAALSGTGVRVTDTRVVASTTLELRIVVDADAPLQARTLTVTNPDLQSASCANCLTVTPGPPAPSAVAPSTLGVGTKDRGITISGVGFQSGATVSFSGKGIAAAGITLDEAGIGARVSIASTTVPGAYDVTVTNPDGQKRTCAGCLFVSQPPAVTRVTPASGEPGEEIDALLTGGGFQRGITAAFSAAGVLLRDLTFISETQLTARISVATSTAPAVFALTVANPDGGTSAFLQAFTVASAPAAATSTMTVTTSTATSTATSTP